MRVKRVGLKTESVKREKRERKRERTKTQRVNENETKRVTGKKHSVSRIVYL